MAQLNYDEYQRQLTREMEQMRLSSQRKRKLFIADFDCTLTALHLDAQTMTNPLLLMGGMDRLETTHLFLQSLTSRGISTIITTSGSARQVLELFSGFGWTQKEVGWENIYLIDSYNAYRTLVQSLTVYGERMPYMIIHSASESGIDKVALLDTFYNRRDLERLIYADDQKTHNDRFLAEKAQLVMNSCGITGFDESTDGTYAFLCLLKPHKHGLRPRHLLRILYKFDFNAVPPLGQYGADFADGEGCRRKKGRTDDDLASASGGRDIALGALGGAIIGGLVAGPVGAVAGGVGGAGVAAVASDRRDDWSDI